MSPHTDQPHLPQVDPQAVSQSSTRTPVVKAGDLLLLHPQLTGLGYFAWAEVELVDFVEDPSSVPWNAGPNFPYRVGFRVDRSGEGGVTISTRGVVWLDDAGRDVTLSVRRIDRVPEPGAQAN
jgi:hypothetical protein